MTKPRCGNKDVKTPVKVSTMTAQSHGKSNTESQQTSDLFKDEKNSDEVEIWRKGDKFSSTSSSSTTSSTTTLESVALDTKGKPNAIMENKFLSKDNDGEFSSTTFSITSMSSSTTTSVTTAAGTEAQEDEDRPDQIQTDNKASPENHIMIGPTKTYHSFSKEERLLTRRKRWDLIDGVPFWTSEFNFVMPITVGFLDYSSKMGQADQDAALVHCLTVSSC